MSPWTYFLVAASLLAQAPPLASVEKQAEARLRKDVTFMAAPAQKGRGNGYPELELVAKRIEGELKALGLKTQVQHFPFIAKVVRERQEASLLHGDSLRPLVWGKDPHQREEACLLYTSPSPRD